MERDDSLRIETPDSNSIKLTSFGSSKTVEIELHCTRENGRELFGASNLSLPPNTSLAFQPEWLNLEKAPLLVDIDYGNDGIIDGIQYLYNELTEVRERGTGPLPDRYGLGQNYPNPLNPTTRIEFSLPSSQLVSLKGVNTLGQKVGVLVNDRLPTGTHAVSFDAGSLPGGGYSCRLTAGPFTQTKKMILIR